MPPVFRTGVFTGKTTSWSVGGGLLSEVHHDTPKRVEAHVHESSYFSILLEGAYSERADDFSIAYEPYTLVFHTAGKEHSDEIISANTRIFFLELLPEFEALVTGLGTPRAHFFELAGGDALWLALRLHREFLFRDDGAEATIQSLLLELYSYAVDDDEVTKEPPWIHNLEAWLREEFVAEPSIAVIARRVGLHPAHVCRAFRKFRGRSLGDYVRGLRIQYVCRSLTETEKPLSSIASEAGFVDQSHMSRTFRRLTGSSPGSYRDALRRRSNAEDITDDQIAKGCRG